MYARILRKWSLTKFLMYLLLLPIIMLLITSCCQNVTSLRINYIQSNHYQNYRQIQPYLNGIKQFNHHDQYHHQQQQQQQKHHQGTINITTTSLSIPSTTTTTTSKTNLALNYSSILLGNLEAKTASSTTATTTTTTTERSSTILKKSILSLDDTKIKSFTADDHYYNDHGDDDDDDNYRSNTNNDNINKEHNIINYNNNNKIINNVPNVPILNSQININLDHVDKNNNINNNNNNNNSNNNLNSNEKINIHKLFGSANLGLINKLYNNNNNNNLSINNNDKTIINRDNNNINKINLISSQNLNNFTHIQINNNNITIHNPIINLNHNNFPINNESINQNMLQPNKNIIHSRNNNKTLKQNVETRRIRSPLLIKNNINNNNNYINNSIKIKHNNNNNNYESINLKPKIDELALLQHEIYYYKNNKEHVIEQIEKQARIAEHRRKLFEINLYTDDDDNDDDDDTIIINNKKNMNGRNRRDSSRSSSFPLHLTQIPPSSSSSSSSATHSINLHHEYQQGQKLNLGMSPTSSLSNMRSNTGNKLQTSSSSISMLSSLVPTTSYSNLYSKQIQFQPSSSSSSSSQQLPPQHLNPISSIYLEQNSQYQKYDSRQYDNNNNNNQQQQQQQRNNNNNNNNNNNYRSDLNYKNFQQSQQRDNNFNYNDRNQYFQQQQQQYFRNNYNNNYYNNNHHQRNNKRQKRYCSARDPAQLAFEAPTVFEGKIISMSSDRRQNFSVTFQVKEIFKKQIGKLILPDLVRLDFTYRNNSGECDIYREYLRPRGLISKDKDKELELGRIYLLFVQQIDIRNFTILGQPILKTKRKIQAVRKGVSQNYEQRASIRSLTATVNGLKIEGDRRVKDGEELRIICRVSGQPPPKVTWFKDSKSIRNRKLYQFVHLKKRSELIIKTFNGSDAGVYECRAKNKKIQKPEKKTIKIDAFRSIFETIAQRSGDECASEMKQYCLHGGTCKYFKEIHTFSCICPDGFYGDRCQEKQWNETPSTYNNKPECDDENSYII